jgi:hypothetical protein
MGIFPWGGGEVRLERGDGQIAGRGANGPLAPNVKRLSIREFYASGP